jgi:hypothetical protein
MLGGMGVSKFPLSHVRQAREIGGPLPVEYVELVAWFYPGAGDGMMILSRRREDGTDESQVLEHRFERALAPLSADIEVPRMARLWVSGVRRMTDWPSLDHLGEPDSEPDGTG